MVQEQLQKRQKLKEATQTNQVIKINLENESPEVQREVAKKKEYISELENKLAEVQKKKSTINEFRNSDQQW